MLRATLPLAVLLLAGCASGPDPQASATQVFRQEVAAAPGRELIVTDLEIGPDGEGEPHSHPWEEFLYIIEGSAIVALGEDAPRTIAAGQSFVIPPRIVHTPRAGPEGVRAIVIRVHDEDDPVMIPAAE